MSPNNTESNVSAGPRGGKRAVPRLSLTRAEAAESLGIGLTTFKKEVQPDLRVVRLGTVRIFPVPDLERWLDENAERVLDV